MVSTGRTSADVRRLGRFPIDHWDTHRGQHPEAFYPFSYEDFEQLLVKEEGVPE